MTFDRRRRASRPVIALMVGVVFALAACSSTDTSSPTPPGVSSPAAAASTTSSAGTAAGGGSATSQTNTHWGRIWDSLPKDFPAIAGSTPDDAAPGPASAVLIVQGAVAKSVATSLKTQLESAGYETTALGGPLEDGTYTLDMTGTPADCMLQVAATPTGGLTTVTILYGAGCPHD
jgi:hypothetical protein